MRKQTKFMAVLSAAAIMTAAAPMMTNYSGIYTSYALNVLVKTGVSHAACAGFDGYTYHGGQLF